MYSPNGNHIASYAWDSTIRIWDAATGVYNHIPNSRYAKIGFTFSPQGDQIASARGEHTVGVWDVSTGECRHILIGDNARVTCVVYLPTRNQIASGDTSGSLRVWDLEAGTCLWNLVGHSEEIGKIVYSSRGDLIISASLDSPVRLWDLTSGQCRAVIEGFKGNANVIAWIEAPSVNYLAMGYSDGMVGMWKVGVDEDHCHVSSLWITTNSELNVKNATIEGVQGLSQLNKQLLKQRGAVGEPVDRLREASEKVATMASVVSALKAPSDKPEEDPALTTSAPMKLLERWLELAKDPRCQELVAATAETVKGHSCT
jgi:WD40 repeat protein